MGLVKSVFRVPTTVVIIASVAIIGTVFAAEWLSVPKESVSAAQTVPYKVNFQGRLTNSAGNVLADGDYNVKFRLYNVSTAGTPVWEELRETTNRIKVTNGLFSVQLGDVTALTPAVFTSQPLYFEVELPTPATATCSTAACATFDGTEIMNPRRPLGASPYAMNSDTLDGIDAPSFARRDQNNTFTGTQIFQTDSATAIQVQNTAGTKTLIVDNTAKRIAMGSVTAAPATLYVQNEATETVTALQVNNQGTGDIFSLQQGGTTRFTIAGTGATTLRSDSTAALLVQNAAGTENVFTIDTTNKRAVLGATTSSLTGSQLVVGKAEFTGTLRVGDATNGADFTTTGLVLRGSARPTRTVGLSPEYAGATFIGDGADNNGSLSSDFCSPSTLLNVNSGNCAAAAGSAVQSHNYYKWATGQTTTQDYDIYVRYKVPADYDTGSMTNFDFWGYATDAAADTTMVSMFTDGSATACFTSADAANAANAWAKVTTASPLGACTINAGDTITFKIRVSTISTSTNGVLAGELSFSYRSKF